MYFVNGGEDFLLLVILKRPLMVSRKHAYMYVAIPLLNSRIAQHEVSFHAHIGCNVQNGNVLILGINV